MANPVSALNGILPSSQSGGMTNAEITLQEISGFSLVQFSAWPETLRATAKIATRFTEVKQAPNPGSSANGKTATLLRIEPLKWWAISAQSMPDAPDMPAKNGAALDLSHSRTWIKIGGSKADTLLNHFLPLDLRDDYFKPGCVASTAFHHVGVTLWREPKEYNLLLPRSFAGSLWELLFETAQQYGVDVK